ncbi:MAG: hypothetical protein LBL36_07390 [Clostridiales Family XIII bacterium]|jgi:hypothetical protein|nr:hypothetical protein [Clostridiales Family XIII bacterium]
MKYNELMGASKKLDSGKLHMKHNELMSASKKLDRLPLVIGAVAVAIALALAALIALLRKRRTADET